MRECSGGRGRRGGGAGAIRQPCTGFLAKDLWKMGGSIARSWRTAGRDSRKYSGGFQQGARHTSKIAIREATSHHKETPVFGCLVGPGEVRDQYSGDNVEDRLRANLLRGNAAELN